MPNAIPRRLLPSLVVVGAFVGAVACALAWFRWGATGALTAFSATWLTEMTIIWFAYRLHRWRETAEDIAAAEEEAAHETPLITSAGVGTVGSPSQGGLVKRSAPPTHSP